MKISSLEFIVTPIQISLQGERGNKYFIEFNKGAQILKKFDEEIIATVSKSLFLFRKGEFAKFKLSYQRGCNCEWGVYKIINRDSYEFIDSLPINLLEYYHNFVNSLQPIQKDYQRILAQKGQGKQVSKAWNALKSAALWQYSSIFAKNRTNNIEICFSLEVRCQLDNYIQLQKHLQRPKPQNFLGSINHIEKEANKKTQVKENIVEDITIEVTSPKYLREEEQSKIQLPPPRMGLDFSYKRDSILSEILQRSNQNQSNVNYGDKKQQLEQISGIPQEESQFYSPSITNTKTMNFQGVLLKGDEDFLKRRCNTYDSNFNQGNSLSEKWMKQVEHEAKKDEELGKQELREIMETSPQSRVATEKSKEQLRPVSQNKIKWIIAIILVLFISGAFIYYKRFNSKQVTKPSPKPKTAQPKPKKKKQQQIKKPKGKK